jgi:hypothetical protein
LSSAKKPSSTGKLKQITTGEEAPSTVNVSTQQTSGLVNERSVKHLPARSLPRSADLTGRLYQ